MVIFHERMSLLKVVIDPMSDIEKMVYPVGLAATNYQMWQKLWTDFGRFPVFWHKRSAFGWSNGDDVSGH